MADQAQGKMQNLWQLERRRAREAVYGKRLDQEPRQSGVFLSSRNHHSRVVLAYLPSRGVGRTGANMATKFNPDGSIKKDSAVRPPATQRRIHFGGVIDQ